MTRPTWVEGAAGSQFDVDTLPYAVFVQDDESPRVGVRIGDQVVDLAPVAAGDMMEIGHVFEAHSLNPLLELGRPAWSSVRSWLTGLLTEEAERGLVEPHLVPVSEVTCLLPFEVADYVDFYCSLHHATNVGRIFRPGGEPLKPNWRHLPVGYHGRAGTVVVSGTGVRRPCGQRLVAAEDVPTYGPSSRLDIEAELGFVVGSATPIGDRVPVGGFADHVFGVTLLNDWSARDIQAWETVPLGPFLGKSFATSVSGWVTPLDALDAARIDLPTQNPEPLDYLRVEGRDAFDIDIEVVLDGETVSRPPYASMYWAPAQMLAHLTVNGASLRAGDLFASGTVSGPEPSQRGSLLELSWDGAQPFRVAGEDRAFLRDGDTVTLRATAPGALGGRIGLGEVTGTVLPARA
jgi:fumarylacetoacetase